MSAPVHNYNLTTESAVLEYLADTPHASTKAEVLSGGTANYTYRLHLREPVQGSKTLILKHAQPFIKNLKNVPFHTYRQVYEVEAMKMVHNILPPNDLVTIPIIHHFDKEANVYIMEDCGYNSLNLKEYLRQGRCSVATSHRIGNAIGEFLARLHVWGKDKEIYDRFEDNKQARELSSWVTYGRLLAIFEKGSVPLKDSPIPLTDEEVSTLTNICKETGDAIKNDTETLVMGDFWPGNLVLSLNEVGDVERIHVLDWEMCKPGIIGVELGQFCAELYTLVRFHPEECKDTAQIVLDEFLKVYGSITNPNLATCRRTAVHTGVHLVAFTPTTDWGEKDRDPVVKEGLKLILDAHDAGVDWLSSSFVAPLIKHT